MVCFRSPEGVTKEATIQLGTIQIIQKPASERHIEDNTYKSISKTIAFA